MGSIPLWVSRQKLMENSMKSAKNEWKTRFWAFGLAWPDDWSGSSMVVTKNVFTKKFRTCPATCFTKMCSVTTVPWIWQMMGWRICASNSSNFSVSLTRTVLNHPRKPIDFKSDAEKWEKFWSNPIKITWIYEKLKWSQNFQKCIYIYQLVQLKITK